MGSSASIDSRTDPYGRLLQRLVSALHEADSLARLADQPSVDMEVRGLSAADLALITAYLASQRSCPSGGPADGRAPPFAHHRGVIIGTAAQKPRRSE